MKNILSSFLLILTIIACNPTNINKQKPHQQKENRQGKIVVYQVFTRLFGNTNTTNKPWGTMEENGVGKFNDFTNTALQELKSTGISHIWYTGVMHHCVITDYTNYGISNDDPDVVKGRAGSPYAVKDYYNVNPDLAENPARRLEEFEALIERTHKYGMKVIIDIVPNHVARNYRSISKPDGVSDFGENDDTTVEYKRDNNFYYIPGNHFKVPEPLNDYEPLGGENHPLVDGEFNENPAKWTGNGTRKVQPHFYDWYETVKVNYGVKPDGTYDFESLPKDYDKNDYKAHYQFWQDKDVPDSWRKFLEITLYWMEKGVDGFRFDMAEMVPVEFWSFMNSALKMKNSDVFILAEVYNPALYRDYILLGKMDYLYDKVELYDTLKHIMQGHGSTDNIAAIQKGLSDIEHNMLHFLENHDEQRIASNEFAGNPEKGKPAMVVSTCISTSPTMLYFGQNVGVAGFGNPGFGTESRTTIFDYWGVPAHQRWMNNGAFDGRQLTTAEKKLNDFYKTLLSFSANSSALTGNYREIHSYNRENTENYSDKIFSFIRWKNNNKLIVVSNFENTTHKFKLLLDEKTVLEWQLKKGNHKLTDQLSGKNKYELIVKEKSAFIEIEVEPLQSLILKF